MGGERGSRVSQGRLHIHCEGMIATKHAPRGPPRLLERRHGLTEIIERGVGILVERLCVIPPRLQRDGITPTENAPRDPKYNAGADCLAKTVIKAVGRGENDKEVGGAVRQLLTTGLWSARAGKLIAVLQLRDREWQPGWATERLGLGLGLGLG